MTAVDVDIAALGRVLDEGRGSLPFALVHGEALVTAATWSLSEAGVVPVDARTSAEGLAESGLAFVLHDSLCPVTPPQFIAECVRRAVAGGVVVAAVRTVTDTVKTVRGGRLGRTLDRDAMVRVLSPVVLPAGRVAREGGLLADPALDLAVLVGVLRRGGPVELLEAPAQAWRVTSADDVRMVEALSRPS